MDIFHIGDKQMYDAVNVARCGALNLKGTYEQFQG